MDSSRGVERPAPEPPEGDWLGSEKDRQIREAGQAEGIRTGEDLSAEPRTVDDATVMTLTLDAKGVVPNLVWSSDGTSVFLAEKRGVLRKIAAPSFREERLLTLPHGCSWLEMSRAGLLVVMPDLQEVWIVGEATLKVVRRIPLPGVREVASSPALSIAFAAPSRDRLSVIDLDQGKVVGQVSGANLCQEYGQRIRRHKDGHALTCFGRMRVTPDGAFLLCADSGCLHRFRIDGTSLTYEEAGPRILDQERIEVSADSRYVAAPSGGGNSRVDGHPVLPAYSTYIYRVADLQAPAMWVTSGAYPRAFAFDKPARVVYAQNQERQLLVFAPTGEKVHAYRLSSKAGDTLQILVRPEGRRVLVLTESEIHWVELPE